MPRPKDAIVRSFTYEGQRYYPYGMTEDEAIENRTNMKRDLEEGKVALCGSMTVRQWYDQYIDTYKRKQSEKTHANYKWLVEHYIISEIGNLQLKKVKLIHCQNIVNKYTHLSNYMITQICQALKFMFRKAIDNDLIYKNPAEKIERPDGKKAVSRRSITEYEREHVLIVCKKERRFYMFLLMLFCGCRPSEATECMGMDIQEIQGHNILHIRGTKSNAADRLVPIPNELYDLIKDTNPFEYIAQTANNNKISDNRQKSMRDSLRRKINASMGATFGWKEYKKKDGTTHRKKAVIGPEPLAKDFVPYYLRHTYCTDLEKKGVDLRQAQYLMGHSDIRMTANIYSHHDEELLVMAAEQIEGTTVGTTPDITSNHQIAK